MNVTLMELLTPLALLFTRWAVDSGQVSWPDNSLEQKKQEVTAHSPNVRLLLVSEPGG